MIRIANTSTPVALAIRIALASLATSLVAVTPLSAMAAGDGPVRVAPDVISGPLNDYNFTATADGTLAVFARSEAGFKGARIYQVVKRNGAWADPTPLPFSDGGYKDSDPWITPDGTMLLFVSTRPSAGRAEPKDTDIWMSRRTGDGWSAPEHLGDVVNSPGMELGPELHGNTLYFNTTRAGGPGTLDIFQAVRVGDRFSTPTALPEPVNSASQEGDFTLTPDGRTAYFWSLRSGKGLLYRVDRTAEGWGVPVALGADINAGDFQFTPQVSADGRHLSYASTTPVAGQALGMADIWLVALSSGASAGGNVAPTTTSHRHVP